MTCHHGCKPTRRLTDKKAKRLLKKLNEIQTRLDAAEGKEESKEPDL